MTAEPEHEIRYTIHERTSPRGRHRAIGRGQPWSGPFSPLQAARRVLIQARDGAWDDARPKPRQRQARPTHDAMGRDLGRRRTASDETRLFRDQGPHDLRADVARPDCGSVGALLKPARALYDDEGMFRVHNAPEGAEPSPRGHTEHATELRAEDEDPRGRGRKDA